VEREPRPGGEAEDHESEQHAERDRHLDMLASRRANPDTGTALLEEST
jgi:hypothetical protein